MQKTIARIGLSAAAALASAATLVAAPATVAAPAPAQGTAGPAVTTVESTDTAKAPLTGLFGESVTAPAPDSITALPATPQIAQPVTVSYWYSMPNWQKQQWFNNLLNEIDPYRRGIWVLDLYGTRTSQYNRGNTYPQSYGKARPIVYIYGAGLWNTWQMRNTMWHERLHVLQLADVGYSRAMTILGGRSGMEATAVCTEHLKGLARPGWGCTSYNMYRTRALWNGTLR